ncbi:MAG TPA: hypothetical protein VD996_11315 [Chitinophagaceae bacterium]|nr:hypothetical protein [Chitinophagaceae bacterium]
MLEPYLKLLSEPLGFWAANCNADNMPDVVHCNGILPIEYNDQITFFISKRDSATFLDNLKTTPEMALVGTNVLTFEGYQFKGHFKHLRHCTDQEISMQRTYLNKFTGLIELMGFSKEAFFRSYMHLPALAVTFTVHDVFEQTPRKGTGLSMINK